MILQSSDDGLFKIAKAKNVQSQNVVSTHLKSKQILCFDVADCR